MAKKKVTEVTEVKPAKRKKTEEKPEAVYIYHNGDDIAQISKALTGKEYLTYKLLAVNGVTPDTLTDGTVLRWGI